MTYLDLEYPFQLKLTPTAWPAVVIAALRNRSSPAGAYSVSEIYWSDATLRKFRTHKRFAAPDQEGNYDGYEDQSARFLPGVSYCIDFSLLDIS
jgi:hypothetical protein